MTTDKIIIDGREISPTRPPYVIAELSANHNGDFEQAIRILESAKKAGVEAVKLQTYTADTITIDHDGPGFVIQGGLWDGQNLYDLYKTAHTPWAWHQALFDKGRELGVTIFSTPFDGTAIDFLEDLGCPAYKIASFECIDLPLIEKAATTGKPLIISTGMANFEEIGEAIETARSAGAGGVLPLHCVSAYPAPISQSNLRTIPDLASSFGGMAGLSDHTPGTTVATAAVALGAVAIEKHLTLSRADGGPDAAFSLEPHELKELVQSCHEAWEALGEIGYEEKEGEKPNTIFRRSLYVVEDIKKGDLLTSKNVRSIRPGNGMPPKFLKDVLGCRAVRNLSRGTPLEKSMFVQDGA